MAEPITKQPRSLYRSGWCGTGSHDRCRGIYAGAECGCSCHHTTCHTTCHACGQPLPEPRHG